MGNWEVDLSLIAPWLKEQDKETIIGVTVALNELRDVGPGLGRPLVDTVKGSSFKNMKELRPPSSGRSEIRILFAFDPKRRLAEPASDGIVGMRGLFREPIGFTDSI